MSFVLVIPADMGETMRLRPFPEPAGEDLASERAQLQFMQETVGGFIEVVRAARLPRSFGPAMLVVNEDGKLSGLPFNARATAFIEADTIVGPALLLPLRGLPQTYGWEQEEAGRLVEFFAGSQFGVVWDRPEV